jgi:hypothetical protein
VDSCNHLVVDEISGTDMPSGRVNHVTVVDARPLMPSGVQDLLEASRSEGIDEVHSYGRDGNDIGGLKRGLPVPRVTVQPNGGVASFWLTGTDEPVGNPPGRCIVSHKMLVWLPGSSISIVVQPLRANGFFWCGGFAAHPILPGKSGSDPSMPLSYYFGTPG